MYGRQNKLSKPKIQKQYKENKINSIINPFILKKKKKIIDIIIKDRTIRDIWTLFEAEKEN